MREPIGVLLYTYDRVEDAYINQEIIRNVWQKSGLFGSIKIVHAYNGQKTWYPQKYLEDVLVRRPNPGHFQGAAELIDAGIATFHKQFPKIRYVVVLAADTWLVQPSYLNRVLSTMQKDKKYWATCAWNIPKEMNIFDVGAAVDFFVIDAHWAAKYKMFPIQYKKFLDHYGELLLYWKGSNVSLEKLVVARFLAAHYREHKVSNRRRPLALERILMLKEREPVHSRVNKEGAWLRKFYWPTIGLVTHHDPKPKQTIVRHLPVFQGMHAERLRKASRLDYFTQTIQRLTREQHLRQSSRKKS